ncbi:hypothetical protein PFISCL1PPCAC_3731, partial [Pristionchus fissidentatus]
AAALPRVVPHAHRHAPLQRRVLAVVISRLANNQSILSSISHFPTHTHLVSAVVHLEAGRVEQWRGDLNGLHEAAWTPVRRVVKALYSITYSPTISMSHRSLNSAAVLVSQEIIDCRSKSIDSTDAVRRIPRVTLRTLAVFALGSPPAASNCLTISSSPRLTAVSRGVSPFVFAALTDAPESHSVLS